MTVLGGNPTLVGDVNTVETALNRAVIPIAYVGSSSSSAAIGTSITLAQTLPSTTYKAGRAYMMRIGGGQQPSTTTAFSAWSVYKTSVAGTLLLDLGRVPIGGFAAAFHLNLAAPFTIGASDVTAVLVLGALSSAGATVTHVGSSTNVRFMEVRDIGPAASYPSAPVLA